GTFASFAPKLYRYYAQTLSALFKHHENLEHNFSNSIFPACTFNCGPRTYTFRHVDAGNLSCGICALTALGRYDPKLGGHLILYSLKLVIEFPPGSTALIPSGAVEHGNTPVGQGETRLSFTQYAAGGLFRWVSYGFQTVASLLSKRDGNAIKAEADTGRWEQGMSMFTQVSLGGARRSVICRSN
ncbi:hypothetical protein FPV67DRAFT_1432152, partial [Lyophyllum atratum]